MSPPPDLADRFEVEDDKEDDGNLRFGFEEGEDAEYDDWNDYLEEDDECEDWESCCSSSEAGSESFRLWPDPYDEGTEASSAPRTPTPSCIAEQQVFDTSGLQWQAGSLSIGLKVVCLSQPPAASDSDEAEGAPLKGDFRCAPPSYWQRLYAQFQAAEPAEPWPMEVPAEVRAPRPVPQGDFRCCPDSYWAAFHQRAWHRGGRRPEEEKLPAPSKAGLGPKGARLVVSRRGRARPVNRDRARPGSRSRVVTKAGTNGSARSKEEAAGSGECRVGAPARTDCYEVTEEEFERLWLSGAMTPPGVGEVEDVYEIPEEDFERLLQAGQLSPAEAKDAADEVSVARRRPRPPEEVLVSTLPAPAKARASGSSNRRHTEPCSAQPVPVVPSGKKDPVPRAPALALPLALERSLWSEAMLGARAAGSPARLLRGLRASFSGSVVPLTETEAGSRRGSSSEAEELPARRPGRLPRMPWEVEALRKSSCSSGTDIGDSEWSSPAQTLRSLAPLEA